MLLKLDELREIGRFSSLKHKAPQFAALSLVYARNGYGKSTISAILRSATEDRPSYIASRRKLDAKGPCVVKSTWTAGEVNFSNGKWTAAPARTYVFDQEFVQKNVHVADSVTRDNKRSLLPVILGEDGVRLVRKIVDLDQEQRDIAATLKEQASRIKDLHSSIDNVSRYCSVPIPADIDAKVTAAARAEELARQTVAVREKAAPQKIALLPLADFLGVASSTIDAIGGDVAARVKRHLEQHALGAQGDRWIKYGVEHQHDDICPFCGQSTKKAGIVEIFRAYYSQAYATLVSTRDAAIANLRNALDPAVAGWSTVVEANSKDFEFWQTVADLNEVPHLEPSDHATIESGLGILERSLQAKLTDPLAVINLDGSAIEPAFALIEKYNEGVTRCAGSIEGAKQAGQFADLGTSQAQHAKLKALEARQHEPMKALALAYVETEKRRDALVLEKEAAQRELTTYAPATIAARQATINSLLRNFGCDFEIVDARANFVGREPNTDFAIAIGDGKVSAGEKSENKPSFKTVLSSADKTTLALAFFFTQVRADSHLKNLVVVFDDPFSSQDMNRQFETTSQIRALASQVKQVIVLSHDPRFLHMIEKDAITSLIELQVQCSQAGEGVLSPWSSADEIKDLYVRNSEIIREYGSHGTLLKNVTEVSVLQAIRPFLEDYIRARFPGRFSELVMLGEMIRAIEAVGVADPLFPYVADLVALNEYTRPNMHGGGQAPNPEALRAQCKRVIDIIGTY
jgi:wobble nucleotide-excising tRNase